ncbi:tigger transposable element-derived protein 2 [Trichonephila inaurata madagascariensis]|uniref:Tigger transposable element-derived protein 2 n=1 Tax=Trichonephila inaurata madagascariensis TaxID=2747483 RepID=A0A8X6K841_9ARAC|nr:tigger transposable element-derived protein 2 [Trichonephila inaurata madagascariensis]
MYSSSLRNIRRTISGNIKAIYAGGSADFKASAGWLNNFKSRHEIPKLQIEIESLSGDKNSAHKFKKTFLQSVEEKGCFRDDVYKVEETGVNWKALPRASLATKWESTAPGLKVSKERVTVMVCANASGTHSLPLLVIGKSKKPRCFKNFSCLPTLYKAQKSAWMNSALFSDNGTYSKDFIPNVKKLREREGKTGKILLILDNAPCHPPIEILNAIADDFSVM